ncbi:MAG: TetR family transcriptional regulator, partial [Solirubrobacteraceae bacterium]
PGRAPSEGTALSGVTRNSSDAESRFGREGVIEIQRARILTAMVEVCAQKGAANVTVAHVVERAGVSRRTFYEIFNDREACFLATFDEGIARAAGCVLDVYDPEARWVERIESALTALLRFFDTERDTGRLLIVDSLGAGAGALERRQRVLIQMITVVDEGRAQAKAGSGLPPLTAEGIVGGVLSIVHARLLEDQARSLLELTGPLTSMIVLPYLGPAAARRELAKPTPKPHGNSHRAEPNPLGQLDMRLTYRTVRVLLAVAASPGDSNRAVADRAGISDPGQISKLLSRLEKLGLLSNSGLGAGTGAPNAWTLTKHGEEVHGALATQS